MFDHEKLDVYKVSLSFVNWSYQLSKELKGIDRFMRDQLLRASHSIPLNIAEGNGKRTSKDRKHFFQIAYGSSLECAAILDVLTECEVIDKAKNVEGKKLLNRIVAMLIKMTVRSNEIRENVSEYGILEDGDEIDQ